MRALWAAVAALGLFVGLGVLVSSTPLGRLDIAAGSLRGTATPLAIFFTRSGYAPFLAALGGLGVLAALLLRVSIVPPIVIFASQLLSQGAVELIKHGFHRMRPDAWLFKAEKGFSFPSGHAVTAIVFYIAWAILIWSWPLGRSARTAIVAVLALWALGIAWSRLALGAHYLTDVLGGYLFGTAWVCAVLLATHLLLHARVAR